MALRALSLNLGRLSVIMELWLGLCDTGNVKAITKGDVLGD